MPSTGVGDIEIMDCLLVCLFNVHHSIKASCFRRSANKLPGVREDIHFHRRRLYDKVVCSLGIHHDCEEIRLFVISIL